MNAAFYRFVRLAHRNAEKGNSMMKSENAYHSIYISVCYKFNRNICVKNQLRIAPKRAVRRFFLISRNSKHQPSVTQISSVKSEKSV